MAGFGKFEARPPFSSSNNLQSADLFDERAGGLPIIQVHLQGCRVEQERNATLVVGPVAGLRHGPCQGLGL